MMVSSPISYAENSSEFCRKKNAMKRLQFRPPAATFGASEAPGHGESIYDGFGADFGADFVSRKLETSKIRKFKNSKLPETTKIQLSWRTRQKNMFLHWVSGGFPRPKSQEINACRKG